MTPTGVPINYPAKQFPVPDRKDTGITANSPARLLPTTPTTLSGSTQVDESVMQISGTGHWFLEGWIGDHSVEFLVGAGSSVTAMSNSFYQTLVRGGTAGCAGTYRENIAQRQRNWNWSVGMLSLCGIVHGTTDGGSHKNLRPCDGN